MPLTVCPNCATPMNEVARRGVYVDVCPSCRGVWLDGGELEKLMSVADQGAAEAPRERRYATRDDYYEEHRGDAYDRRGRDQNRGKRREGGIFGMFDDLFD
ncbi:MAG: zf-TFIIB domain-containing protein [Pseudomonadota bacterium]